MALFTSRSIVSPDGSAETAEGAVATFSMLGCSVMGVVGALSFGGDA